MAHEVDGAGQAWVCVCSFPSMNWKPIVLLSREDSGPYLTGTVRIHVVGSTRQAWWQTSVIPAL